MDGLRWLLLFSGLLVIAAVYFYSRRDKNKAGGGTPAGRREPKLDSDSGDAAETVPDAPEAGDADEVPDRGPVPQKIVTLRLVTRDGGTFPGDELILSLRGIGLRHGKFGIFHRYEGSEEGQPIFSAASLVEPGSFDLENIKEQRIPGISLFLVLPGPVEAAEAFDLMLAAARTLAQSLSADLLDESGSTLSIQRERYMREEVIQFEHSSKVA